jgi:hypothetical protein
MACGGLRQGGGIRGRRRTLVGDKHVLVMYK